MAIRQAVTLNVAKRDIAPIVWTVEDDTDRILIAKIEDLALTSGMTATMYGKTAVTGEIVTATGTIDTAENTVTVELDDLITETGTALAQIKITDGGEIISTFAFFVDVQKTV